MKSFFLRPALGILTIAILTVSGGAAQAAVLIPVTQVDVTYSTGSIIEGPLSFGLSALPAEVNATFLLGTGTTGAAGVVKYYLGHVSSGQTSFGDAHWTSLTSFYMETYLGNVASLTYEFAPIDTATTLGGMDLNFPLTITGTDRASGLAFEYQYTESTQTIRTPGNVPEPGTLALIGFGLAGMGLTRRRKKA